jgi:hypothetical protein
LVRGLEYLEGLSDHRPWVTRVAREEHRVALQLVVQMET